MKEQDFFAEAEEMVDAADDENLVLDPATGSRPNRAKSKTLTLRLTAEEFDAVQEQAQQLGVPASAVVRSALRQYSATAVGGESSVEALARLLDASGLRVVPTSSGKWAPPKLPASARAMPKSAGTGAKSAGKPRKRAPQPQRVAASKRKAQ